MVRRIYFLLGLLASVALFSSCLGHQKPKPEEKVTDLDRGYRFIELGKYSEAIDLLEDLERRQPSSEVEMVLASAYAGRAGVHVSVYWSFVIGYEKPNIESAQLSFLKQIKDIADKYQVKVQDQNQKKLNQFSKTLATLKFFSDRFSQIPIVENSGLQDIVNAIEVLQKTQNRGAHVYRSILGLVLLRTQVEQGMKTWNQWVTEAVTGLRKDCELNLEPFFDWATQIIANSNEVVADLKLAFPSQEEQVKKAWSQLEESQNWIQSNRDKFKMRGLCLFQ